MSGASVCINSGDGGWVVVDTVTFMCLPLVHMYMLFLCHHSAAWAYA